MKERLYPTSGAFPADSPHMKQSGNHAEVDVLRRSVVCGLISLLFVQAIPCLAVDELSSEDLDKNAVDLNAFMRLSENLTGVFGLDQETALKILELIRAEPWGENHLAQIGRRVLPVFSDIPLSTAARQQLFDSRRFSEGERWFIGHLLTTWFIGIYYHQTGDHLIDYRGALMHVALQDIRSIPGHCDGVFGFWSEPPAGARR